MNWYVLYTKSRYEKAVAEKLALSGIDVYCPLLRRRKLWSDRWKFVEEPMFMSYCFVQLEAADRNRVFNVPGVVRYLHHCGKPAIIRHKDMDLLKAWLMQYDHGSIETSKLNANDNIRIRSGALINKKATVVESKGNFAILFLNDLGLQVKVDLRKNIVEKLTSC